MTTRGLLGDIVVVGLQNQPDSLVFGGLTAAPAWSTLRPACCHCILLSTVLHHVGCSAVQSRCSVGRGVADPAAASFRFHSKNSTELLWVALPALAPASRPAHRPEWRGKPHNRHLDWPPTRA